ncbi:MAG: restriction endonuclease, partial [Oscillatoria sp. PMC 1076.18]|nr:restriction endonuclease [Oscillatoria sp. PMC 1076.18]
MNQKYRRNVKDLRKVASMFWPSDLSQKEAELSIVPKLLETQEQFITILSLDVPNLDNLFQVIDSATMSASMFLKHLMVLADVGAEKLDRWNSQFLRLFPSKTLEYLWKTQESQYLFKELPIEGKISNKKLKLTGKSLLEQNNLSNLTKDIITLILFGSSCKDEITADVLQKCEIAEYLGQPDKLENYIKQRYIWVSRIT